MTEGQANDETVYAFILDHIDSVPHLEALLLLWNTRPKIWSVADVASRVYVQEETARGLLEDLGRNALIASASDGGDQYRYESNVFPDALIQAVDRTYRSQLVRVSTLIHSKASRAVRDFASAFRFTKEKK